VQATKDLIKSRYSSLMWNSGLLSAWLKVRPRRHRVAILNYHHISADVFEDHLRSLCRAYSIISLDDCHDFLLGDRDLPPNSVVLTFDDAYRQFHDEIHPILERFDFPATMFVPTASIDAQEVLWFNRVKALVHGMGPGVLHLGDSQVTVNGDRRRAYHGAIAILNELPLEDRDAILESLFRGGRFSDRHLAKYRPMAWDDLRAMRRLITVGAHTVTHPNPATLRRERLVDEIEGSKRRLEAALDREIRHFAYPFGQPANFSRDVVACVRHAGFSSAATTIRGSCGPDADRYRLPRVDCDGIKDGRVLVTRLSDLWVFLST